MENYHRTKRADFFELFGIKPQEASKHNDEDLEFSKNILPLLKVHIFVSILIEFLNLKQCFL